MANDDALLLAFLLTFGAGFSTTIGALFTFCVNKTQTDVLPIALSFSSGVMIYVSFVGILPEAMEAFSETTDNAALAHFYFTLSFLSGVALGYGLDLIAHWLGYHHELPTETEIANGIELAAGSLVQSTSNLSESDIEREKSTDNVAGTATISEEDAEAQKLIKMSFITALAIAIHNLPEGLATFVSTLADPALGISIAVAVAIHNIPEGISVAVPIYFATGSRLKAVSWAFMSGIFEPIGGLIGYAIIGSLFGPAVFGVLFGLCAGVMLYIAFREMLPTARQRDKEDKYCTYLLFAGFLIMDLSFILFKVGGGGDEEDR